MDRPARWVLKGCTYLGFAGAIWIGASTLAVIRAARGKTYSDVAATPSRRVGLVLGTSPRLGNGDPNQFFEARMDAAARLFRAGKVQYLIVSGDNHTRGYDEPSEMKAALVARQIPADRIY